MALWVASWAWLTTRDVQRLNAGEAGGSCLSLRRSCLPLAGVQCPLCCLSSVLLAVSLPVRSLASMLCVDQCRTQCFLCPGLSEPVPSPVCWLLQVVRVPFGMEPPWCPKWSKRVLASRDLGGAAFALLYPPGCLMLTLSPAPCTGMCVSVTWVFTRTSPVAGGACEQTAASLPGSSHDRQTRAPVSAKSEPYYGS